MNFKISIVMSTYNEELDDLKKAIDSMLNQTFKNFEFIIILDDPENEKHKALLMNYSSKDSRIKVVMNEENIGLAASLNKGIDIAKGKYIARMDADDISEESRLEKEYNFLELNKDIDIVSINKVDINEKDEIINIPSHLPTEDKKIKEMLKVASVIVHSGVMYKKESIIKIGKYRLFPASQDYDLWLRASYYNLKFAIIDEPLIKYRVRENNISNSNPLKQYLLKEYIRKLYKQRLKTENDDFSIENLQLYLENNKAFDKKKISKYKNGLNNLNKFKFGLKNKKIFLIVFSFLKIIFSTKEIKYLFYDYIKMFILKVGK